jgi:hypothetical protein
MIDVPEQYYSYLFSLGNPTQKEYDYDANGNNTYIGIASNTVGFNDPGWVVQKATFVQITVQGSQIWVPQHSSVLTGVIWNLRSTYTFP